MSKPTQSTTAKPFLKWAGGKTQLLKEISKQLPSIVKNNKKFTYIEPFVGSGAVLFWLLNNFSNLERAIINDINKDLTNCYSTIKNNVNELITILELWENKYHNLNQEQKKEHYYYQRNLFNTRSSSQVKQSALFIFLNKTCFNGLYRVNKQNYFNVPIGSYKKPLICNKNNLLTVSKALQKVTILNGDFEQTVKYATKNTFFYFDPPYKPINKTSSFNSYTKNEFNDTEQERLRNFCILVNENNYKWLLSNSDLKNSDTQNNYFDELYSLFSINRIYAKRFINSNSMKRGNITELLIGN